MKRITTLCLLLLTSGMAHAFTMTEKHCEILYDNVMEVVSQKAANGTLSGFTEYVVQEQLDSPDPTQFAEIRPFIDAIAAEYFKHSKELGGVDYVSVVSFNCRQNIGNSTPDK